MPRRIMRASSTSRTRYQRYWPTTAAARFQTSKRSPRPPISTLRGRQVANIRRNLPWRCADGRAVDPWRGGFWRRRANDFPTVRGSARRDDLSVPPRREYLVGGVKTPGGAAKKIATERTANRPRRKKIWCHQIDRARFSYSYLAWRRAPYPPSRFQ